MAGLFGNLFGGPGDKAGRPCYSIDYLQHLYNRLQQSKDAEEQNRDTVVEVIRQITEALIWGEQNSHDHDFFDFFCEKRILAEFVRILGLPHVSKSVKIQLLQTLSILIQNICRDTSLYYLFSNNYVNQLISTQFDWSDEEILGYYISFLKSLALRLTRETIKFFFNERSGTEHFPLYVEAVRFFGHHEQMVRTSVRTLTLQVYSVDDPTMRRFVLEQSSRTYFVHLACHLREIWGRLNAAMLRAAVAGASEQSTAALQEANEQQQDLLMYISDVFELEVPDISGSLADRIFRYAVYPILLQSLLVPAESRAGGPAGCDAAAPDSGDQGAGAGVSTAATGTAQFLLSPACALFIIHTIFDICRSQVLLEPLAAALLQQHLRPEVARQCRCLPPDPPPTYRATTADVSGPPSVEAAGADPAGGYTRAAAASGGDDGTSGELPVDTCSRVSLRTHFLAYLSCPSDPCVLLAAGILRACLKCRAGLPQLLRPPAPCTPAGDTSEGKGSSDADAAEAAPEVLVLLVRAIEHHTSLRVVVLQTLVQVALAFVDEVAADGDRGTGAAPLEVARRALQSAARHVRTYLHGDPTDGFLDIFAEEWEPHGAGPAAGAREACSSVRCLLPAVVGVGTCVPVEWTLPTAHSDRQHAAKAIRCLLIIQRLHARLSSLSVAALPHPPAISGEGAKAPAGDGEAPARQGVDASTGPLLIPEEAAGGYQEGLSFELGRQDRIVCGIVSPEGRYTRYLVLHPFLLLLVQPDLEWPGWAVVKTLAPIRQVDPCFDHADSRVLRLTVRMARGARCPSDALPCDPSAGAEPGLRLPAEAEHHGSSFFILTLNFEDVTRCKCAESYFRARRCEVRSLLKGQVKAFVDGFRS